MPEQRRAGRAAGGGLRAQGGVRAAKVGEADLGQAAAAIYRAHQQVGWLDVVIGQAVGVAGGQRCEQLAGDVGSLALRQGWAVGQPVCQVTGAQLQAGEAGAGRGQERLAGGRGPHCTAAGVQALRPQPGCCQLMGASSCSHLGGCGGQSPCWPAALFPAPPSSPPRPALPRTSLMR